MNFLFCSIVVDDDFVCIPYYELHKTTAMRTILSVSFFLVGAISFVWGQSINEWTTPTQDHQQVNGTNVFLIPPTSFGRSTNFKGFQNPLDPTSMIMVVEIPGPFTATTEGFNQEVMASRGMELTQKDTVQVGDNSGLLIGVQQSANGMTFYKTILVYGNDSSTVLINGVHLKDSIELGRQIKQSIMSTVIDEKAAVNPRSSLGYVIDETVGGLKFHSVIGNGMLFNRDLKIPTESEDMVILITDKSFAEVQVLDRKQFCKDRLSKYPDPFEIKNGTEIKPIKIDSLEGFSLQASNLENPKEEMYQVILFEEGGGYYLMIGTYLAKDSNNATLEEVKSTIATFKRK